MLALIKHLGCLALGRATDQAIRDSWSDSPTARDILAYILANSPDGMKHRLGITWDDSDPIRAIWERDFPKYKGQIIRHNIPWMNNDDADALVAIFEGLEGLAKKPIAEVLCLAREEALIKYLWVAVKNNLTDSARLERRRDQEDLESELDGQREDRGQEVKTNFLDTLASGTLEPSELIEQRELELEDLSLDLDKLTAGEHMVLADVFQGLNDGYEFSSKVDNSFAQYWGKDYPRKIKAWERCKAKLKLP